MLASSRVSPKLTKRGKGPVRCLFSLLTGDRAASARCQVAGLVPPASAAQGAALSRLVRSDRCCLSISSGLQEDREGKPRLPALGAPSWGPPPHWALSLVLTAPALPGQRTPSRAELPESLGGHSAGSDRWKREGLRPELKIETRDPFSARQEGLSRCDSSM